MDKHVLRAVYLEKRKTLTQKEFDLRNRKINHYFKKFLEEQSHIKAVHIFMSMPSQREVETMPLIDTLWKNQAEVVLPKVIGKRKLSHHRYQRHQKLKVSKWGIAEPDSNVFFDEEKLDAVFIPMIIFDKDGSRIGYGGGFYDTFLKQINKKCLKVGLCLTPPLDKIDFIEAHDIPLDYCITHLGIYKI